jgi:prophage regulatory protein
LNRIVVSLMPAVLDLRGVCSYLTLSTATVQGLIRQGTFPKPKLLSQQRVGWLVSDVNAWLAARPDSDLLPPRNTGLQ